MILVFIRQATILLMLLITQWDSRKIKNSPEKLSDFPEKALREVLLVPWM